MIFIHKNERSLCPTLKTYATLLLTLGTIPHHSPLILKRIIPQNHVRYSIILLNNEKGQNYKTDCNNDPWCYRLSQTNLIALIEQNFYLLSDIQGGLS